MHSSRSPCDVLPIECYNLRRRFRSVVSLTILAQSVTRKRSCRPNLPGKPIRPAELTSPSKGADLENLLAAENVTGASKAMDVTGLNPPLKRQTPHPQLTNKTKMNQTAPEDSSLYPSLLPRCPEPSRSAFAPSMCESIWPKRH